MRGWALWAVGALLVVTGATGCRVVGPNYARPAAPPEAAYREAPPAGWQNAQPADAALKGAWWEVYADPRLNQLEAGLNGNFSLQAAQDRYLQSHALIQYYQADAKPTVAANPALAPQRESGNRPLSPTPAATTFNNLLLPLSVSWEPDFWGRVHREVEQQSATAQGSAADLANLRLSLQADVAQDYFAARGLDAEAAIFQAAIANDTHALQLTETRHSGGIVSAVDVAQAQTQLESTRAQAADLQVERTQLEHALAVLLGQPPAGFQLATAPLTATPPPVPVGVPADLLQRRPDIALAERQMAADNAAIGIAQSAFYPAITLGAGVGLQSTSLGNLFTLPSALWSLGANALETITTGGHRTAITVAAQHAYDAQVATYRQTVLNAFQEVDDNLAALRVLENEATLQAGAVAAAEHSLALSNVRYEGGVTTYLEVITAQSTALVNERAAEDLLARRMAASVQLIKALGGGWNATQLPAN